MPVQSEVHGGALHTRQCMLMGTAPLPGGARVRTCSKGNSDRSQPWLASFLGRLFSRAWRAASAAALRRSNSSRRTTSPLPRSLHRAALVGCDVYCCAGAHKQQRRNFDHDRLAGCLCCSLMMVLMRQLRGCASSAKRQQGKNVRIASLVGSAPKLDQVAHNVNIFQVEDVLGCDLAVQVLFVPAHVGLVRVCAAQDDARCEHGTGALADSVWPACRCALSAERMRVMHGCSAAIEARTFQTHPQAVGCSLPWQRWYQMGHVRLNACSGVCCLESATPS